MAVTIHPWEHSLLSLAHEAWHSTSTVPVVSIQDQAFLSQAYADCEALTSVHSRSFHLASALLPRQKRKAVRALYAFCRTTDDVVDEKPSGTAEERSVVIDALDNWRQRSLFAPPRANDSVVLAWADARSRYQIPQRYAEQLIEGVAQDIDKKRYATFAELTAYCYGVASTVGLMSMYIIGFAGPEAISYAVKLGVALQLTNILRDVREDWAAGRLYLPLEELEDFGLTVADIEAERNDERWRSFMQFQIQRNRQLYAEAWPGIGLLDADGRFSIAAAAGLYQGILDDIEAHHYDVFSRRAYVGRWGKLRKLPNIWWRSRRLANGQSE